MPLIYTLNYETIKFTGGELSVRGLALPEINQLVAVHTEAAMSLFGEIQAKAAKDQQLDIGEMIFDVLNRFQAAVAHAIALAADAPDQVAVAAQLPMDVQLAAIEKIAVLSFAMDGGAKKFWETVQNLALAKGGLGEVGSQLLQTFMSGSGPSEGK